MIELTNVLNARITYYTKEYEYHKRLKNTEAAYRCTCVIKELWFLLDCLKESDQS